MCCLHLVLLHTILNACCVNISTQVRKFEEAVCLQYSTEAEGLFKEEKEIARRDQGSDGGGGGREGQSIQEQGYQQ